VRRQQALPGAARRRTENGVKASARQRIVDAARAHFLSHGFRTVTMDDLARELGISKKTLYTNFAAKEALLEAVLESKLARVGGVLESLGRDRHQDFPARLQQMLAALQKELEEIRPPFVRDMRRHAPHVFEKLERRRQKLIGEHFGKLFRDGQQSGDVRADLPLALVIEALLAAVHAIVHPQKLDDLRLEPREAFTAVVDLILHGALRQKGGHG
jgi:AcrR family transcriptional regulator